MTVAGVLASADETLDRLAGDWWILQSRTGQRYATDDLLVAWNGLVARPDALRVLDLGSGVGSVGLLALLGLPVAARLTAVEVQPRSAGLMRRTLDYNGLGARVDIVESDLRALVLPPSMRFELILANPPYVTPGRGTPSPHAARANARLELNGNVFDYCRAAEALLADAGRFCFSHAAADVRPERAITASGLRVLGRQDVIFRQGQPPLIAVFTCGREGVRTDPPALVIREAGVRSDAFLAIRRRLSIDV